MSSPTIWNSILSGIETLERSFGAAKKAYWDHVGIRLPGRKQRNSTDLILTPQQIKLYSTTLIRRNEAPMFEDVIPEPAITLAAMPKWVDRIGVIWRLEDAEKLYRMYDGDILILCVKVPMCKYCLNMEEVQSFFEDRCWRS